MGKQHVSAAPDNLCGPPVNICFSISEERALPRCEQCLVVQEHTVMSLKVSIGQGTRGVIVEKDRKKEKKERRSRSERDLREVISREVRGTGDLRDRLEEVRGAIREEEQRVAGRDPSETCEMPICNTESKLTVYSDEKKSRLEGQGKLQGGECEGESEGRERKDSHI